MVSVTTVVVLACACVVIEAQLELSCMKIRKGSTKGFKHYLRPVILSKEMEDFEMALSNCPYGKTIGVDAQACDDDQIPEIKFADNDTITVHRSGNLASYTVVIVNLYCATPDDPNSVEIPAPV